MKKIGLGLFVLVAFMGGLTFAAGSTSSELKSFSNKLENHKNSLLKNLSGSENKLRSIARDNKRFSESRLFNAASCLGVVTGENQTLDYSVLTKNLKNSILNEYIKLDGEIKKLSYGIASGDSLIFGNSLDNFYNQNALKITGLESDYYSKSAQVRKTYEQYIKNNEALLETLAGRIDTLAKVDKAMNEVNKSFSGLNNAIDKQTNLWKNLEKTRVDLGKSLDSQLSQIISEVNGSGDAELQAKFLSHKVNFLKKFEKESKKALYAVFSENFDYGIYQDLASNYAELHQMFDNGSGKVNCPILLTSTLNFNPYLRDLDQKSSAVVTGMDAVTYALNNNSLNLVSLEQKLAAKISSSLSSLTTVLLRDFRLMLNAQLPQQKVEKSEVVANPSQNIPAPTVSNQSQVSEANPVAPVKTTFTQAFKKGQYHEQVKSLQTLLTNWGLYHGTINGVYDKATIEAVYQFQLKYGVVTGKEKKKTGYGRFGFQTRAKINQLING
ncbi:MAG: peptidoglycan-binding protein [candidate division SR1 bacterium]|nr:peptidoglycan-binding protein [candidate division SR1 bacterium]